MLTQILFENNDSRDYSALELLDNIQSFVKVVKEKYLNYLRHKPSLGSSKQIKEMNGWFEAFDAATQRAVQNKIHVPSFDGNKHPDDLTRSSSEKDAAMNVYNNVLAMSYDLKKIIELNANTQLVSNKMLYQLKELVAELETLTLKEFAKAKDTDHQIWSQDIFHQPMSESFDPDVSYEVPDLIDAAIDSVTIAMEDLERYTRATRQQESADASSARQMLGGIRGRLTSAMTTYKHITTKRQPDRTDKERSRTSDSYSKYPMSDFDKTSIDRVNAGKVYEDIFSALERLDMLMVNNSLQKMLSGKMLARLREELDHVYNVAYDWADKNFQIAPYTKPDPEDLAHSLDETVLLANVIGT